MSRLGANLAACLGLGLMAGIVLLAVVGPFVHRTDPWSREGNRFEPPGGRFVLGTDHQGRDVLAGLVVGAKSSLLVGVAATAMILLIGLTVGIAAGYRGGWLDETLMRITEFFQILPAFLFAMVVVAIFSPWIWTIVLAIGASNWAGTARIIRAQFLSLRERDYVLAARALGVGDLRIIVREILPNALPPVIVAASVMIANAILTEAGLSFLNMRDPNLVSWGGMIGAGRDLLRTAWFLTALPGVAIAAAVLSLNLVGDGLNEILNPRSDP